MNVDVAHRCHAIPAHNQQSNTAIAALSRPYNAARSEEKPPFPPPPSLELPAIPNTTPLPNLQSCTIEVLDVIKTRPSPLQQPSQPCRCLSTPAAPLQTITHYTAPISHVPSHRGTPADTAALPHRGRSRRLRAALQADTAPLATPHAVSDPTIAQRARPLSQRIADLRPRAAAPGLGPALAEPASMLARPVRAEHRAPASARRS
eukprot:3158906-Rhodomonas_salina.2